MYLGIPMVTGRTSALAMGTSWCIERGAREENTRRVLSTSGELEGLHTHIHTSTGGLTTGYSHTHCFFLEDVMMEVEEGILVVSIWHTVNTLITERRKRLATSTPSGRSRAGPTWLTSIVSSVSKI